MLVTGATARVGSVVSQIHLSRIRADAVKDFLVALGVSPDRIKVSALGSNFPEYVPDFAPDGSVLLAQAQENRKFFITVS